MAYAISDFTRNGWAKQKAQDFDGVRLLLPKLWWCGKPHLLSIAVPP